MDELVVHDEYIEEIAAHLGATATGLEEGYDALHEALQTVCETGIEPGSKLQTRFAEFTELAGELNNTLEALGAETAAYTSTFLQSVDDADEYLY